MFKNRSCLQIAALSVCGLLGLAEAQTVVYVDEDAAGANNGSSWCNAYVHLQDALAAAAAPGSTVSEIRVAAGTYLPDEGAGQVAGNRSATFRLIDGVALIGGYAGCGAPNPDARDPDSYDTVLDGDLLGDDLPNFVNRTDNVYHVVTNDDPSTTNTTVIDGFTIRGGHADGVLANKTDQGPGLHNFNGINPFTGKPLVRDCLFIDNWAANHGALNDHGGATIIDCEFRDNFAAGWGGGLYVHGGLAASVTNCGFFNNRTDGALGGGGAVTNEGGVFFDNCRFEDNVSLTHGGAVYNHGDAFPYFEDCVFARNQAEQGGAVYNSRNEYSWFVRTQFIDNVAADVGGAVYDQGDWPVWVFLTFDECTFLRNTAQSGGALYFKSGGGWPHDVTIRSSSFIENHANGPDVGSGFVGGGAIWLQSQNIIRVTDSLFLRNSAVTGAGAIYSTFTTVAPDQGGFYVNCKFIGNTANYGGAASVYRDNSLWVNCLFSGNHSVGDTFRGGGGAINNYQDSGTNNLVGIRMHNCTLMGNSSDGSGGAFHMRFPHSILRLYNSIVWGNTHQGGAGGEDAALSCDFCPPDVIVDYSSIQGWTGTLPGTGTFGNNPLFANAYGGDGIPGTADDHGRLLENSPCVDTGDESLLTTDMTDLDEDLNFNEPTPLDLDLRARVGGAGLDMGAYEYCGATVLFGDVDDSGGVNFTDISLIVNVFQGGNLIPFDDADIFPCGGDDQVNFNDISACVQTFQGSAPCPDECIG